MLAFIPILVFVTVVLLMWALVPPGAESLENRLRKHGFLPTARQVSDLKRPFSHRVLIPWIEKLGSLVAKVTPGQIQRGTVEKLERANLSMSPAAFLLLEVALGSVLAFSLISPALRSGNFGAREIIVGPILFFLGTRLPDFWLSRKFTSRQHKIRRSLPDALDLITICVEAGYGLDAALAKVTEKTKGPLAEELSRGLLEVNLGKPRSQALRDLAQRTQVAELQAFIATIVQAEQMGVSIANILRVQSDSMRVKRRQTAEEEAMKAPVKMLFPLVLFIFPAMFVVILGPTIMRLAGFIKMGPPG